MKGELVNGAYYVLGALKGSARPGLKLAHSLVTGELVTLAVPAAGGESPTADELRQEGEVFGEIASPYVQAIVDHSAEDVFIAWEYVPAWTLTTVLRTSPTPSVATVLQFMHQVAQGLGAVHGHGAIYRGLYPGRILLLRDGSARLTTTPEALLLKRGRVVDSAPPAETPIRYLSPEQIEGTIDARSDLYSLATVGYELLTGGRIYSNPDPVTLAVEILKTSPPPPSAHRPDIPPLVDEFFTQCLARRPDDRPRNVAAFLSYLNKVLANVGASESESLAVRLALHPVAYPLLASDTDRAALSEALSSPSDATPSDDSPSEPPTPTAKREPLPDFYAGLEEAPAEEEGAGEARADGANDGKTADDSPSDEADVAPAMPVDEERDEAGHRNGFNADRQAEATESRAGSGRDASLPDSLDGNEAVLRGADGTAFRLNRPDLTIGRRSAAGTPDIDLTTLDQQLVVSRKHAALHFREGRWHVLELRARNGTWLNDERIEPGVEQPLTPGDTLRLANVELVFDDTLPAGDGGAPNAAQAAEG